MTLAFDYTQSLRVRNNARILQLGSFGVALGLFCLTPLLPKPEQKLFAAVPGAALVTLSLLAGRDHFWADRKVRSFVMAEDGGYRQSLVAAFMGNKGMGTPPAQLEAEVIEDDDNPLYAIAEMDDDLASAILLALNSLGYAVTAESISDRIENEAGIGYLVKLPAKVLPTTVAKRAVDIRALADLPVTPVITPAAGGVSVILPYPKLEAGGIDDPIAQKIEATLRSYQADSVVKNKIEGLAFDRYLLTPKDGIKFGKVAALGKELQMGLGLSQEPLIASTKDGVAIDVARAQRTFVNYDDYIDGGERLGCQVPVGVDQLTGELIWMDFADSNTCHSCVAGSTGSGKSEALRSQIKYIIENHKNTRLLLVDVKASTFSQYAGTDGVTVIENAVYGAIAIVEMAAKMEQRRTTRKGFKDVAEYNAQAVKPLPRILIYVEELKDMLDGLKTCTPNELEAMSAAASIAFGSDIYVGYSGKMKIEDAEGKSVSVSTIKPDALVMMALGRIGQAGRSEDINLNLITQEPDKDLLDSLIGNLPAKIGLRLNSYIESNVILPGKNAHCEQLLGKGDLIYSVPGHGLRRLQSLWVG